MARNAAAKRRQGLNPKNGKATRSAREVGTYGKSRPRDDASVRRAKQKESDPRLKRAAAEQEVAEEKLRQLAETIERTGAHPLFLEEARASVALDKDETHVVGAPRQPGQPVSAEEVADFVARSTEESGVPLKVEDPEAIQKVATLLGSFRPQKSDPAAAREARALLEQGYHIERVVQRTGVPWVELRQLVGKDGYAKC